eukprot:3461244-Prymnesium_polylepis.1
MRPGGSSAPPLPSLARCARLRARRATSPSRPPAHGREVERAQPALPSLRDQRGNPRSTSLLSAPPEEGHQRRDRVTGVRAASGRPQPRAAPFAARRCAARRCSGGRDSSRNPPHG